MWWRASYLVDDYHAVHNHYIHGFKLVEHDQHDGDDYIHDVNYEQHHNDATAGADGGVGRVGVAVRRYRGGSGHGLAGGGV